MQALTNAAPPQDLMRYPDPTRMEDILLGLLEDLRNTMINGSDDVPVLDPLELEHVEIHGEDIDIPGLTLTLTDFVLKYLSTFEVHSLHVTNVLLIRYTINFDGSIPLLEADAREYDLDLNIDGLSVFGKGEASIQVIKPRVTGRIEAAVRVIGGLTLEITNCDIVFHLEGIKPKIRGLFGNEAASDFANVFLENLVPDLVTTFESDISAFLNELIPEIANEILADLDLSGIFG
ncbi:hypothetical protein EVAR_93625_1 [Eumeta japonica]|uniref:Circadian clock-controlled protein n=1 Tax=Eumeta variegata TaxID=151549 RepID=A0A4C1TQR4_EUMVA|nr:hypothetical protein EVAR_93625_1 [Eumeta japonica]